MTWRHTNRSQADYDDLEKNIQKAFDKQVTLLSQNLSGAASTGSPGSPANPLRCPHCRHAM
jgi:hypothetical protein